MRTQTCRAGILILAGTALGAACSNTTTLPGPAPVTTFAGTVARTIPTGAQLQLRRHSSAGTTVLASTSVTADGSFSLTLPAPTTVEPHAEPMPSTLPDGCTGTLNISDPAAKITSHRWLELIVDDTTEAFLYLGDVVSTTAGATTTTTGDTDVFFYSDRRTTVTRDTTCTNTTGTETSTWHDKWTVTLAQGWTPIRVTSTHTRTMTDGGTKSAVNSTVELSNTPTFRTTLKEMTVASPTAIHPSPNGTH